MVALKEKQAAVCGPLGEIQATLCGEERDQCGEAAQVLLAQVWQWPFSCLLLSQLCWDATSSSSPHLREMGLSMLGCSVFTFPSLESVPCQENRSLKNLMEQEYRTHEKNQQNNEMSELIALGAPFPAVLGVPSNLYLTVFFSCHKDKGSGTDFAALCGGTDELGSHTLQSCSRETALSVERSPSEQSLRMSPTESPEAKQQKNTLC